MYLFSAKYNHCLIYFFIFIYCLFSLHFFIFMLTFLFYFLSQAFLQACFLYFGNQSSLLSLILIFLAGFSHYFYPGKMSLGELFGIFSWCVIFMNILENRILIFIICLICQKYSLCCFIYYLAYEIYY